MLDFSFLDYFANYGETATFAPIFLKIPKSI